MKTRRALAVFLVLATALGLLAGSGLSPEPEGVALAPAAATLLVPDTATAVPSPTWTPTMRPTQAAARPSLTATPTPTSTSSPRPSLTPSPTLVATPTPAATVAGPTAAPTVTLTATLAPSITPTPSASPTPLPTVPGSDEWLTVLLIGLDSTENLGAQNTDVILVAFVNSDSGQVSMLSIPRDLWVYIPRHGWNRINTAHKMGHREDYPGKGPGLLRDTIAMNLGLTIDHWARVDFEGFTKVVDELGGVEITVTCPVNLDYRDDDPGDDQILEPGAYHMDGATALRYVRTRRGNSDFDRARRQQQFLRALWNQRKNVGFGNVIGLFSALTKSIETDLRLGDILPLVPVALELEPQHIRSRYIGRSQTRDWVTSDGWQVLLPRTDKIQEVVSSLYAPPSASLDQAAGEAARIEVLNGTSREYLLAVAVDELRWYGLGATPAGPADRTDLAATEIIVFRDKPKALAVLTQVFGVDPKKVNRWPDPNQTADLRVILGADYDPCQ